MENNEEVIIIEAIGFDKMEPPTERKVTKKIVGFFHTVKQMMLDEFVVSTPTTLTLLVDGDVLDSCIDYCKILASEPCFADPARDYQEINELVEKRPRAYQDVIAKFKSDFSIGVGGSARLIGGSVRLERFINCFESLDCPWLQFICAKSVGDFIRQAIDVSIANGRALFGLEADGFFSVSEQAEIDAENQRDSAIFLGGGAGLGGVGVNVDGNGKRL